MVAPVYIFLDLDLKGTTIYIVEVLKLDQKSNSPFVLRHKLATGESKWSSLHCNNKVRMSWRFDRQT